jgi:hypothetical protein
VNGGLLPLNWDHLTNTNNLRRIHNENKRYAQMVGLIVSGEYSIASAVAAAVTNKESTTQKKTN